MSVLSRENTIDPLPVRVQGYDYDYLYGGDQPYLLELWIEKSTMNDILLPICEALHVNLIPRTWGRIHLLPRVPIKEKDMRRAKFEKHHGEGAVELDALEALYPGELAPILQQHADALNTDLAPLRKEVANLEKQILTIVNRHETAAAADLAPLKDEMTRIQGEVTALRESFTVDLPARPMPRVTVPDESAFLFDASRDAVTQLQYDRRHQEGTGGEAVEEDGGETEDDDDTATDDE